jgi:hypothetical protein
MQSKEKRKKKKKLALTLVWIPTAAIIFPRKKREDPTRAALRGPTRSNQGPFTAAENPKNPIAI